jgi:Family of unknown function (DUF5947)
MTGALQRVVDRAVGHRAADVERCGLCGDPVGGRHRHVLDGRDGPSGSGAPMLCVCLPCAMLFERDGAGGRHYQLVPDRRIRVTEVVTGPLRVPVGLAFFVKQDDASAVAHYPSPLGTTRNDIGAESWAAVAAGSAALCGMRPHVEALLVWTRAAGDRTEQWILGIDECYRLAGVVRRHWTGMSGGTAVWREVAGFFEELNRR